MQSAATAATSPKVAATHPAYAGSLSGFLQKQHTATAEAAGLPFLTGGDAMMLSTMRRNILSMLTDTAVFAADECRRCVDNVKACQCVAQLQRWFRNVHRVRTERELAQAVAARAQRGRTADFAAELSHTARQAEFTAEIGLSYSDLLAL